MQYYQAPLPFVGQKRRFAKDFARILRENIGNGGAGWTILDAFGGSGLLAHTARHTLPQARVIYNDHDHYADRLRHIADTNRQRRTLEQMLENQPRNQIIPAQKKLEIIRYLEQENQFIDLKTLSTWFLFSCKEVDNFREFIQENWYHRLRKTDIEPVDGYLDGIEITSCDYRQLLAAHTDNPQALFVLDPPYLMTQQGSYRQKDYFGMVNFLQLMRTTRPPFVFFSSTRSEAVAYLDWLIKTRAEGCEKFRNYCKISLTDAPSKTVRYENNMIYKFNEETEKK